MIDVKLSTIITSADVLQYLSNSAIKGRTAYKVAKILKRVDEEFALFNDARNSLINEYAIKGEDGTPTITEGNYNILPERVNDFNNEITKLMDTDVHMDVEKLRLEEIENIDFTPQQMLLITDFIEE